MEEAAYDYVIVGAGSAGCLLANRLSENPGVRVLLLEAGPRDWHPLIHMPAGLARLAGNTRINWNYETVPQPGLGGRTIWWPRGKVLGGSSSINAMCYIRGVPGDYHAWAVHGATGWDWAGVLPYFVALLPRLVRMSPCEPSGAVPSWRDTMFTTPLMASLP